MEHRQQIEAIVREAVRAGSAESGRAGFTRVWGEIRRQLRALRDTATREQLRAFFRSLPVSRFPTLAAHGVHAWDGNRDQRFTAGLETLLRGLQADMRPPGAGG